MHIFFVILKSSEELCYAANVTGLAFLGCMVTGWEIAEGWSRCEKGKKVRREFVGHLVQVIECKN